MIRFSFCIYSSSVVASIKQTAVNTCVRPAAVYIICFKNVKKPKTKKKKNREFLRFVFCYFHRNGDKRGRVIRIYLFVLLVFYYLFTNIRRPSFPGARV